MKPFYDQQIAAANVARFRVPVVPGLDGASRPAGPGEAGHLERLLSAAPVGAWPLADRWKSIHPIV